MSNLEDRMKKLTPKQRALLELQMKKKKAEAKAPEVTVPTSEPMPAAKRDGKTKMDFTVMFFSDDGRHNKEDKYSLVMEAAEYADKNGFKAIWTPERHFQTFGGLYPNPTVLSAALAMKTEQIKIRAGSYVLPLHGVIRAAEDWSLVDNLSKGRVEISFASGWHTHDFTIKPEAYHDRREFTFRNIETMKRLWRGETIDFTGVDGKTFPIKTLPRPIQDDFNFWVSCSSANTWERTGQLGGNVLAVMLSGPEIVAQLVENYRNGRRDYGHDPRKGTVTIMLHTFLGESNEAVYESAYQPLKEYLGNYTHQFKVLLADNPNFKDIDEEGILKFAVDRYFNQQSLLGTQDKCAAVIESLAAIGVSEIACLIDFGLPHDQVMKSLERLNELRQQYA